MLQIRKNRNYTDNRTKTINLKIRYNLPPEDTVKKIDSRLFGTVIGAVVTLVGSVAYGQIDFDRPDVIRTSFAREMEEALAGEKSSAVPESVISSAPPTPGGGGFDNYIAPPQHAGSFDGGGSCGCSSCGSSGDVGFSHGGGFSGGGCSSCGGNGGGDDGGWGSYCGGDKNSSFFKDAQFGCGHCGSGGFGGGGLSSKFGGGGLSGKFGGGGGSCSTCGSDGGGRSGLMSFLGGGQRGLLASGIVEIPLDGVFLTGDDARVDAATLGVDPAVWPGGTPFDLLFSQIEFEEVYRTLGGVEANLTRSIGCNTQMFFGYRYVKGSATSQRFGTAIAEPLGAATSYDINASFSDYEESRLQLGFLTSNYLRRTEFLWGGRIGVGFVDDITGTFDIEGLTRLEDIRLYDDTTNLAFGFNFGFKRQLGCKLSAHALTGLEYRTSLDSDDRDLRQFGLEELNDGSGFASLPIYLGFTYHR